MPRFWQQVNAFLCSSLAVALTILFLILPTSVAEALNPQQLQQITWMEQAILSVEHPEQPVEERITNLEIAILGEPQSKTPLTERLQKLDGILRARKKVVTIDTSIQGSGKSLKGQQPKPLIQDSTPQKTTSNHAESTSQSQSVLSQQPVQDISDYPIIEAMEYKIWGKTYGEEPIQTRLDRLDTKVFGQPQSGHYAARTDNLKTLVLSQYDIAQYNAQHQGKLTQTDSQVPKTQHFPGILPKNQQRNPHAAQQVATTTASAQPNPAGGAGENLPTVTDFDPVDAYTSPAEQADLNQALGQVEQDLLGAQYPNEVPESRLARLEQKLFNQTAPPSMSNQDRLERIITVASVESANGADTTTTKKGIVKTVLPFIPIILLMLL